MGEKQSSRVKTVNQQLAHTRTEENPFSPGIQEPGAQDHDGLARALLQLHLDGAELLVDDGHHLLDLLGGDGPRPRLLPQQVHHMVGELAAGLQEESKKSQPRTEDTLECCRFFLVLPADILGPVSRVMLSVVFRAPL